jgi:CDP-diacylglycerol---glycerol-3-phosphate 3-phosphatidyltransferase
MSNQPYIFSDQIRILTKDWLNQAGMALFKLGIHPDWITAAGLVVVGVASVLIAQGQLQLGGVILLLGLPLDALDGAVARAMQRQDKFGQVLDSTLDRYADAFIFAGLGYYFAVHDQFDLMLLALASLMGSFVVSYVRARADGVNVSVKIGLFDRLVRIIFILAGLLVPFLLIPCLWVLAIGANFTGLQRLWYVHRALNQP